MDDLKGVEKLAISVEDVKLDLADETVKDEIKKDEDKLPTEELPFIDKEMTPPPCPPTKVLEKEEEVVPVEEIESKVPEDEEEFVSLEESNHEEPEVIEIQNADKEKTVIEDKEVTDVTHAEDSQKEQIAQVDIEIDNKRYPTVLNPFGDEEEEEDNQAKELYPTDLNPFGEEEVPASVRNKGPPKPSRAENYNDSLNPFGDDDEEEGYKSPSPIPAPRRSIMRKSLKSNSNSPASLSRGLNSSHSTNSLEKPARPPPPKNCPSVKFERDASYENHDDSCGSTASPKSSTPLAPKRNIKKKPAPKAPASPALSNRDNDSDMHSINSSVISDSNHANNTTLPISATESPNLSNSLHPIPGVRRTSLTPSMGSVRSDSDASSVNSPSKESAYASFMKKKRQAPLPPQAIRREVSNGSIEDIESELNEIGDRLAEIDLHVGHLNQEFGNNPDKLQADLIYNYLEFAKETCFLARKQEELMYRKREVKLEEEHADIEYQIRLIELKPQFKRTQEDDEKAQELLKRLIEVIDERNDVVENMSTINKRPDFDKLVKQVTSVKGEAMVNEVLLKFFEENDMKVVETKVFKLEGGILLDDKQIKKKDKKEKKKKDKKEKKDKSESPEKDPSKPHKHKSALSTIKKFGTLGRHHSKEPKQANYKL